MFTFVKTLHSMASKKLRQKEKTDRRKKDRIYYEKETSMTEEYSCAAKG